MHTHAHAHAHTHGKTLLNKWSARHRSRYLHNTQQTQEKNIPRPQRDSNPLSKQSSGYEPKISAGERPQAARLLRSWVRILPGAWIFVCCECRVLSGRGLCDELITRAEESYRLWCVVVCNLETSRICAPYIYIYIYIYMCVCVCIYIWH